MEQLCLVLKKRFSSEYNKIQFIHKLIIQQPTSKNIKYIVYNNAVDSESPSNISADFQSIQNFETP